MPNGTIDPTLQAQTPRTIAGLIGEGNLGALALTSSRLAQSAGEATPSQRFMTEMINLLTRTQQLGTLPLQQKQLTLQEEQAQRLAAPLTSGMPPSYQRAIRSEAVGALEPTIAGIGQRAKTFSEQIAGVSDILSLGRSIMQGIEEANARAQDDARQLIRDAFTYGGAGALEAVKNQPELLKTAGYNKDTFDQMVSMAREKELEDLAKKQVAVGEAPADIETYARDVLGGKLNLSGVPQAIRPQVSRRLDELRKTERTISDDEWKAAIRVDMTSKVKQQIKDSILTNKDITDADRNRGYELLEEMMPEKPPKGLGLLQRLFGGGGQTTTRQPIQSGTAMSTPMFFTE